MKAVIDADNIAYACAAGAENESEDIAIARANTMVEGILQDTNATEYELWLSGPNNFRYTYYPEYKANRIDTIRPTYERAVRAFLADVWQANTTDGYEADDALGVAATENTILCHLDKDINQVPGKHFNWELWHNGKVIREKRIYEVTELEGLRFFYYQMLIGDTTDGIKGVPGIGPKKADKLLDPSNNYEDPIEVFWFKQVREAYGIDEAMDMNGKCLWIWQKPNDIWSIEECLKRLSLT